MLFRIPRWRIVCKKKIKKAVILLSNFQSLSWTLTSYFQEGFETLSLQKNISSEPNRNKMHYNICKMKPSVLKSSNNNLWRLKSKLILHFLLFELKNALWILLKLIQRLFSLKSLECIWVPPYLSQQIVDLQNIKLPRSIMLEIFNVSSISGAALYQNLSNAFAFCFFF